MGARETPFIDWRTHKGDLQPFLIDRGGVVHVKAAERAAADQFADAVGWLLQASGALVLRLNGDDSTRYFSQILALLEDRLQVPPSAPVAPTPTIQVASNLTAGASISMNDVDIHYSGDTEAERHRHATETHKRCARLMEHVREKIRTKRLCLVFFGTENHAPQGLNGFRDNLWDRGLDELVGDGLLLLDFHGHPTTMPKGARWPLSPDLQIFLDARYDKEARHHATEDLSSLLQKWGAGEKASSQAEGVMLTIDGPEELYAKLAGIQLKIRLGA